MDDLIQYELRVLPVQRFKAGEPRHYAVFARKDEDDPGSFAGQNCPDRETADYLLTVFRDQLNGELYRLYRPKKEGAHHDNDNNTDQDQGYDLQES